jgi:putative ABC transport system permease protein
MIRDLQLAFRQLRRNPGFTAVAVVTVALGIGACTAIFTVVDRVLLRPPPVVAPEGLVSLRELLPGSGEHLVSFGAYHDWRREAASFAGLGALMRTTYNLTGAGAPIHPHAARISASLLPMLGVRPQRGRGFLAEEELGSDRESVALVSHGFWQRAFGGADVLGRSIQLNGRSFTVVGVLPRESPLPADLEIFTPLGFWPGDERNYQAHWLEVSGRLRPGVTVGQARAELGALATRIRPRAAAGATVAVLPLVEASVRDVRPVLLALLGAVGFLLLIACANVANLLLARATARGRELAVRAALGASRERIVRQLLTESLLLALLGGALGVLGARAGVDALLALVPEALPRAGEIAVDGRALAFTLGLAVLTGVAFGLVPAFQASRPSLVEGLRQSRLGEAGPRQRLRRFLVAGQMAVAVMLLAGAGLLMRSFLGLQRSDPGFDPRGALIASVFLPRNLYPEQAQHRAFARQLVSRLEAQPGVQAAAVATNIPFADPSPHAFAIPGQADRPVAHHSLVSPGYFRAMSIPLVRGRLFTEADGEGAAPAALINQALARRFFPGQDPLGRRIQLVSGEHEIVGVVGDVKLGPLETQGPETYEPFAQSPSWAFTLVVRGADAGLGAAVAAAITSLDPDQPTQDIRPLAALVADSLARQRFAMILFAVFSGTALLLAAVGLYGVVSYLVARRTAEFGVRLALGARAGNILGLVLAQGGRMVALGLLVGLGGALVLTRLLRGLLVGISPHDPFTYVVVVAVLGLAAGLACLLPARRAARVEPMAALRVE